MIHFVNLTRGLYCPHLAQHPLLDGRGMPMAVHYTRIQSTHCEQKNWPGVIYGAGPDLLVRIAQGDEIVVHDKSENDHETRAMWQGLKFIRRACETLWDLSPLSPVFGRGGLPMEQFFDGAIARLDRPEANYLRYYRRFYLGGPLNVRSCWDGR